MIYWQKTSWRRQLKICWWDVSSSCLITEWNWLDIFKIKVDNRDLAQQDGQRTQDHRMTKTCPARRCILAQHFLAILSSWIFQPSCCIRSQMSDEWLLFPVPLLTSCNIQLPTTLIISPPQHYQYAEELNYLKLITTKKQRAKLREK